MILRRVLMVPFEVLFRDHLRGIRRIALLVSGRVIFDGLGGALWKLW